jgi:FAD synthetase
MGERDDWMIIQELAVKYIQKAERVFTQLRINRDSVLPDTEKLRYVIEEAKRYFEDAKYYLDEKKYETSLASISYCEGLLDAARMLGFIEFSW